MKHIITLILAIAAAGCLTLSAQEIATQPTASQALLSPENVGYAHLTPRSQLASYPTRDQMMAGGTSAHIIPLQEWQSEEVEAGTKYTTRFKRNYRLDDKEIILCIENATGAVSVEVNGNEIGYSVTGSPRAEFDLTKKLKENNNTISVVVHRNYAARDIEPAGEPELTFSHASIITPPRVAVADITVDTKFTKSGDGSLKLGVVMQSFLLNSKVYEIYYEVYSPEGEMVASSNKELTTRMLSRDTVNFYTRIPKAKAWSPSKPNLYRVVVFTKHQQRFKEFTTAFVGFRTAECNDQGEFIFNGDALELKSTPFVYTTKEESTAELTRLKEEGYNLIFTARPQSDELYRLCDQMGMLVCCSADITSPDKEASNTQSNNPKWKNTYLQRAESAYHSTKLHPSVVMFSLAYKAQNGICLYESYLAMKAIKDEKRPFVYPDAGGQWNTDL